jgi:predicted O-methyltransferase YrrM
MIPPTLPGSEYGLHVPADRADGARLFVSRKALATWCRAGLPDRPRVAEVGVFGGAWSSWLLDTFEPSELHLIDTFCADDHVHGEFTASGHLAYVQAAFADRPEVHVRAGLSWDALAELPDDSLDYVYVDADHSYESVQRDIAVAHAKVRSGGIVQFNDYTNYGSYERAPYGVLDAVNEYVEAHEDVSLVGLALERSGYHDLAVRVVKRPVRPPLVVVTPCSRPENLDKVKASLDFSRIEAWHVIYDTRTAPFVRRFEGHPQIVEWGCSAPGVVGHPNRNAFLDSLDANPKHAAQHPKLVYFLDDDNTVHPDFWSLPLGSRGFWTFDMQYADGAVRRGDTPLVNQIDTAQFVFSSDCARGLRFDADKYNADGMFVHDLWERDPESWTYCPGVAATYNRLRDDWAK